MYYRPGWWLSLVCLAGTACTVDLLVPEGANIACSAMDACPEGLVCDLDAGVCVPEGEVAPTAPVVTFGARVPNALQRITRELAFDLSVADANAENIALQIQFQVTGEDVWRDATVTGIDLANVATSPGGEIYNLRWDAVGDLSGLGFSTRTSELALGTTVTILDNTTDTVALAVTAVDPTLGAGVRVQIDDIALGNGEPVVTLDTASLGTFISDDVPLPLDVADPDFDPVDLEIEFRPSSVADGWEAASIVLGSTVEVATTGATQIVLVWDSRADTGGIGNATERLIFRTRGRDTPDGDQHLGTWYESAAFQVANQTPPVVLSVTAPRAQLSAGTSTTPIYYTVADNDLDPVDSVVEFSIDLGTSWTKATEYRNPLSEGRFGLATTRVADGGINHRFDWDPGGVFLGSPQSVQVRVQVNDGKNGAEESIGIVNLLENVGPSSPLFGAVSPLDGQCGFGQARETFFIDVMGDSTPDWILVCPTSIAVSEASLVAGEVTFDPPVVTTGFVDGTNARAGLIDGDTQVDLVIQSSNFSTKAFTTTTWFGASDGTFTLGQTLASVGGIGVVSDGSTLFDVDGDDDLDIVIFGEFSGQFEENAEILLYENNGSLRSDFFSSATTLADVFGPLDLTATQLPDGRRVLLAACGYTLNVLDLTDPGNPIQQLIYYPYDPDEMELHDVDQDGLLDIVSPASPYFEGDPQYYVFRGTTDPDNPFLPPVVYPTTQSIAGFALSDVNADGFDDAIIVTRYGNIEVALAEVFEGRPTGAFSATSRITATCGGSTGDSFRAPPFVEALGSEVTVRAPDGCYTDPSNWTALTTTAAGSDIATSRVLSNRAQGTPFLEPIFTDTDRDGSIDFVGSSISLGSPSGRLSEELLEVPAKGYRTVVADVDGGAAELITINQDSLTITAGPIWDATSIASRTQLDNFDGRGNVRACDVNGDGVVDVVATPASGPVSRGLDDVFVWRGRIDQGVYSLDPEELVSGAKAPRALDCGDLDNDGLDDLVFSDYDINGEPEAHDEGHVAISTGDGFDVYTNAYTSMRAPDARIADLTGDGVAEIVVNGSNYTAIYGGNVNDGYTEIASLSAQALEIQIADMNLDGVLDLLYGQNTQVTFAAGSADQGRATGGLEAPISIRTANYASQVLLGDLNDDQELDITWLESNQRKTLFGEDPSPGRTRGRVWPRVAQAGDTPSSWTPVASTTPRVDVFGEPLPEVVISSHVISHAYPGTPTDILRWLKQGPARGTKTVLASVPRVFAGDVHLRWQLDSSGENPRRRVAFRPELGIDASPAEAGPAVWFTFDIPVIEASRDAAQLRVFRLVPTWSGAAAYPADPEATSPEAATLMPRVVDSGGELHHVIERIDRWEEVLSAGDNPNGTRYTFLDPGTSEARLRIVSERLGVFVALEVLPD